MIRSLFGISAKKKEKPVDSGKMLFLESVRGLAALSVVWAHILATYFPSASVGPGIVADGKYHILTKLFYGLPFGFTDSGSFAVVLFFTLSGFVLTYKYFQTQQLVELQKQAAKRYFRLAIPVFCTVFFAYILLANGAMINTHRVAEITQSPEAGRIFNFSPTFWDAMNDATVGVLVNNNTKFDPVLWTMPIEFIGSFVIFGFIALIGRIRKRWIFYMASLILLNQSYYVCFVLGAILADILVNTNLVKWVRDNVKAVYVYTVLILVAIVASFPYPDQGASGQHFHMPVIPGLGIIQSFQIWHFIAAAVLLFIVLTRKEIQGVLSNRILVFFGGISFALYLVHYLILHSLGDSIFIGLISSHGRVYSAVIAAIATVLVTVVVSAVWKKYIDDMSVRVSRYMAQVLLKS